MSERCQENLIAGSLFIVFAVYLVLCHGFGPNARLVPLPMAILGLLLVSYQLIQQNWIRSTVGTANDNRPAAVDSTESNKDDENGAKRDSRLELQAVGCVAGFVLLITLLGPIVAVFLFSSGYLIMSRYMLPGKAIVTAAIFSTVLYLLFVTGLRLQLYHGILTPLVDRI